jgi:hypothetical protein
MSRGPGHLLWGRVMPRQRLGFVAAVGTATVIAAMLFLQAPPAARANHEVVPVFDSLANQFYGLSAFGMRSAHPGDVRRGHVPAPRGPRRTVGSTTAPLPATFARSRGLDQEGFVNPPLAPVGKILSLPSGGGISACSGTVVGRTLIFTAAHCVYDAQTSSFHQRVLFAPGLTVSDPADPRSRSYPYEAWEATRWFVPTGYQNSGGDPTYDYALAYFPPSHDGRYIGDVTGTVSITVNHGWSAGDQVYATGYPAAGYWATPEGLYSLPSTCASRPTTGRPSSAPPAWTSSSTAR